jgi:hypothetical protein
VKVAVAGILAAAIVFAGVKLILRFTGPDVPEHGTGKFSRADGTTSQVGTGIVITYRVEVERGSGQDPEAFARSVDKTLADRRGWTAGGHWAFVRVDAATTDLVVRLATPATADALCAQYGLHTEGQTSCRGGDYVIINLRRWMLAIPAYQENLDTYRHLVVNHEVGHFLGHDHVGCPGQGKPAPVMMTQIYGLDGCRPNAWPYLDGQYVD